MNQSPVPPPSTDRVQVAIVGVGLIGGSLAAALKARHIAAKVIGVGRNISRLESAQSLGLIDVATTDIAYAAQNADLIVFCTPVDLIAQGVEAAVAAGSPQLLLTDVGSVKGTIAREVGALLPAGKNFIGSHPLAGSERNGFENSDADLFEGKTCIITPCPWNSEEHTVRLTKFWESVGSSVLRMTPDEHDRKLAQTSHLPHVLAAALATILEEENHAIAATGFRDSTRIAAGDPDLWVAIILGNAQSIVESIDGFSDQLAEFRAAIEKGDAATLKKLLDVAKTNRDALS